MSDPRPKILMAFSHRAYDRVIDDTQIERLAAFAEYEWLECDGWGIDRANDDPATIAALSERIAEVDGLIVCHGAPCIDGAILDKATRLKIIGELEGDRFAARIDLEAAWARGIRTVDTTNASSYPVAEWALGLILISLRNIGAQFRRIIAGLPPDQNLTPYRGPLTGRRVGLIGCGNMGRRLIQLLRPFDVEIWVHDPYLSPDMADALGFLQTSLDNVLSQCDVVVCLAPLTPKTRGMIGAREIELIQPGAAFVNVSRGAIVDSAALIARLKRNDITAGLEVWDPEPIPEESEIRHLPNAFVTPHTAGRRAQGERNPFFGLMVEEFDRFFHGHETKFDLTPASQANRSGVAP
ncbi:MAG: hydroxyacid dehydrogenase [Caldilineaceae bacterium]|nr:hydroxyacid dehydrogenase [Caldilineaceae bacterium]